MRVHHMRSLEDVHLLKLHPSPDPHQPHTTVLAERGLTLSTLSKCAWIGCADAPEIVPEGPGYRCYGPCHDLRVVCFSTAFYRLNEQEWMLPCDSAFSVET